MRAVLTVAIMAFLLGWSQPAHAAMITQNVALSVTDSSASVGATTMDAFIRSVRSGARHTAASGA